MAISNETFRKKYGPWALVAGASEGLGAEFASLLAAKGLNLILVARRLSALEETALRLRTDFHVEVRTSAIDIGSSDSVEKAVRAAADADVGLLVCNAAKAYTGPFLGENLSEYNSLIDTNCRGTLGLVHAFARKMTDRGCGGIVVMSSMAGFQGSPFVTVYGATKAFLLAMAESLSYELGPKGIDVLAVCPTSILTPNYLRGGNRAGRVPLEQSPETVAEEAISALGRRTVVIPGFAAKIAGWFVTRVLTRKSAVSMMGKNTEKLLSR